MALVTVQRASCSAGCVLHKQDGESDEQEDADDKLHRKRGSECYFAVKGAALVLPHDECLHVKKNIANGVIDIQSHLQSMLYLLRPEDTLKMAVKLESVHGARRTRYLVVVSWRRGECEEESCILGVDCNSGGATLGLVLPIWASTTTTLDGDGGFSITSINSHHIFKPVSVQAMWSALQSLHKARAHAQNHNHYPGGGTHQWVKFYEDSISSDQSCLNEWNAMDDLVSRRPPSPDVIRLQPTEREATEKLIHNKLKELMMSVDLDEVTCKYIRGRLEEELDMNLREYKSYIDQDMLTILGQMDAPAEIFDYLYLGSEWNASNLDDLMLKGVGHILNVTREIDNFFPGKFDYLNIRVYDDEMTDLLPYWDKTYRYISKIRDEGHKVLVHCKMGISRSASVVIAYLMKAYGWKLDQAMQFVKNKRSCIKPNCGFLKQLEIYQGILNARHNSLWRSKSETNLQSAVDNGTSLTDAAPTSPSSPHLLSPSHRPASSRPKSWSPDDSIAAYLFPPPPQGPGGVEDDTGESQNKTVKVSIKSRIFELEAAQQNKPKLESRDSGINLALDSCTETDGRQKTEDLAHRKTALLDHLSAVPDSKETFSYDKEDIPWTPGTVLKTKQQLEAQSFSTLKRASSFESVLHSPSLPSPEASDINSEQLLQRSQSFRFPSEHPPFDMVSPDFNGGGIVKRLTKQLESKMTEEKKSPPPLPSPPLDHHLPPPIPSPTSKVAAKLSRPQRSHKTTFFSKAFYTLLPGSGSHSEGGTRLFRKVQHGKTHPLSKLHVKNSQPVPAYHTV